MSAPASRHAELEDTLRAVLCEAYQLLLAIAESKAGVSETVAEEVERDAGARSSDGPRESAGEILP